MSEKLPSNQPQPIVKIGHYTLGQTLGVGTFGKVKSMYTDYLYDRTKENFVPQVSLMWRHLQSGNMF